MKAGRKLETYLDESKVLSAGTVMRNWHVLCFLTSGGSHWSVCYTCSFL